MEFKTIVRERYATKKFDGRTVGEDRIDELLELIRLSPSSLNLQPWKIKVITDRGTKEALLPASWNQPQITTCSHLLVFCANADFEGVIARADRMMKEGGAPEERRAMVIGMARGMGKGMSPDQRLEWARCQVHLALGNALNGAKALGLDSCPMAGFDSKEYARILGLPPHLVPTVLCPVGYAADQAPPKVRLPKDEVFFR